MTIISSISNFLKKDKVKRVFYFLGLVTWLLINENQFHKYDKTSSFGITYFWLILIPSTLLLLQIIFNNRVLWFLIFASVLSFTLYSMYYTLTDIIERSGNHVKAIYWDFETTIILIAIYLILFLTNWILYKLKPNRRKALPVTMHLQ